MGKNTSNYLRMSNRRIKKKKKRKRKKQDIYELRKRIIGKKLDLESKLKQAEKKGILNKRSNDKLRIEIDKEAEKQRELRKLGTHTVNSLQKLEYDLRLLEKELRIKELEKKV